MEDRRFQVFKAGTLGNFFIISLAGAFILISLHKLNKLTEFLKPLNTKGANFLIEAA